MDLRLKTSNFTIQQQHKNLKGANAVEKQPLKNDISFGTSYEKIVEKGKQTTYTQINKISRAIDNTLGNDKFFSSAVKKAGFDISNNSITIKETTFLEEALSTLKYPFVKMPLDIANCFLRGMAKTPLKGLSEKLSSNSVLQKRAAEAEAQKSFNLVKDALEQFSSGSSSNDIEKCTQAFMQNRTFSIKNVAKNYSSRDERTLNRMVTSTVSAIYSAKDFYNISMLQKDNKNEAQKAEKSRFKQEMTRMCMNAGITFFTLGALDKYVKTNIVANSLVIALSALISEVGSRLLNGTPLRPLSPEEAAKIANKKKNKGNNSKDEAKKLPFRGSNNNNFSKFVSKEGTLTPLDLMKKADIKPAKPEESSDKNKKISAKKIAAIAFGTASLAYLASKGIKGEYSAKIKRKALISQNIDEFNDFVNGRIEYLNDDLWQSFKKINKQEIKQKNKFSLIDKFKKLVTKKNTEINLEHLKVDISKLRKSESGSEVSGLLKAYNNHLDKLLKGVAETGTDPVVRYEASVDRMLTPGIYNGATKIFKTVYSILSAPGVLINEIVNKLFFNEANKITNEVAKINDARNLDKIAEKYKSELANLSQIINKHYKKLSSIEGTEEYNKELEKARRKIVQQIKKNTRNFEKGAETGELANLSRTMVTAITTYFFVNDYTNKVLIESEGKDIDKAKEERNDRIAHKLSNFVINGTLMNLFNSVFKTQLNDSLLKAGLIAGATEATNEFLVRKSICQPVGRKESRQAIVDYEEQQLKKKGLMGSWSRLFRKITGKKTLTQKAGIAKEEDKK